VIVLDASVALAWCFEDEHSPVADDVADRLQTERAIVPAIWPFEVGNALLAAVRRGRLEAADRPDLMNLLSALPIEIEPISLAQAIGPVADIAGAGRLSTYDAAYVELAHRLALPLATLDARLAAAAREVGVRLVEG
jgi:predicted nucleic acid-binding protein